MARHTFTTLFRRLSKAGFKKDFVNSALLPDWWEEACAQEPSLLPEIEIRVARFLGLPLASVRDPGIALAVPSYADAKLRRVRDVDGDRLTPAIHSALRIGAAVVRNLRDPAINVEVPSSDGIAWRRQIASDGGAITLQDILVDLWRRGIPVIPVDVLPVPSFQGAAFIIEGRPVIVLSHRHDEPGRAAFLVAHETGHIAASDCMPDIPVVDEEGEVRDEAEIERIADRFARRALVGSDSTPQVSSSNDYRQLARDASNLEREIGADASMIIFAWASRTGDYPRASMAVKALYRHSGARRLIRRHFKHNVDIDDAPDTDRALLRCVYGDRKRDAAAN